MKYTYHPQGICATQFDFEINNDIIKSFKITNGCQGNTQGISNLIVGMNVKEVIKKLKEINCHGRGTSCPDQIAKALEEISR